MKNVRIHATAEVSSNAKIGEGTSIWNQTQVRENSKVGKNCVFGKNVYVDRNVVIGNNVKIQNNSSVYEGVTLQDGVFVGPHVSFTNDRLPRAINVDGTLKKESDWKIEKTLVRTGASIGAKSVVMCGITVGEFAMVGVGSVITKDVPSYSLVFGNPARLVGYVCKCGFKVAGVDKKLMYSTCPNCKTKLDFLKK